MAVAARSIASVAMRSASAPSCAGVSSLAKYATHDTVIGIGGGVGPMAGVEAHRKVIEWTLTDGTDWDHLEVHHLSRSHDITGRPAFIFGEEPQNPGEGMARTVKGLAAAAEALGKKVVVGVPCNTFHHAQIWARYAEMSAEFPNVRLVHMLEETVKYMNERLPSIASVGILCTTATREAKIFDGVLEGTPISPVYVEDEDQGELQESISNLEWGLKAVTPPSARAVGNVTRLARQLQAKGVDGVILGCTEMPLVLTGTSFEGTSLIDPVDALARALVREVDASKLKPLKPLE